MPKVYCLGPPQDRSYNRGVTLHKPAPDRPSIAVPQVYGSHLWSPFCPILKSLRRLYTLEARKLDSDCPPTPKPIVKKENQHKSFQARFQLFGVCISRVVKQQRRKWTAMPKQCANKWLSRPSTAQPMAPRNWYIGLHKESIQTSWFA